MIKKITPIIFLFSTIFGSDFTQTDIKATIKSAHNGPSIKKNAIASFATGIIGGIYAAYEQHIQTATDRSADFYGLSFIIPPFFVFTPISIITGIILSQKLNLINFLLPPYITIPTFYTIWLATHYLLNYDTVNQTINS